MQRRRSSVGPTPGLGDPGHMLSVPSDAEPHAATGIRPPGPSTSMARPLTSCSPPRAILRPPRAFPARCWRISRCSHPTGSARTAGVHGAHALWYSPRHQERGCHIVPRSVVLATALVSLALPALARGELSERQKRKALLPALHATTECIAQEILRSPTALSHARQNKWSEAVQSMPEVCKALGSTLIAEHDRLYGPGTGKAFVEGPYASDLPRALKARIRPALKRQAAQFAMVAEAPEPAAAATDTAPQVTPSPPLVQSNPVVEDVSAPPVQKPTGTTEPMAIKSPPAAEIAAPPVKSAARDVTVTKPPDENRLDRSTHPSRAYSLAFVAVFAGAALLATGRALGLRVRGFARWRLTRSKPC